MTFTFDQESRSKATVHHSPKGTHQMKYEPDKGGELMLLTNDMGQMKGQTD